MDGEVVEGALYSSLRFGIMMSDSARPFSGVCGRAIWMYL